MLQSLFYSPYPDVAEAIPTLCTQLAIGTLVATLSS